MCAQNSNSDRSADKGPDSISSAHGDMRVGADRHESGVPEAHAELQSLADRLREALLTVAWRQWRVLGAGAAGRSASTTFSRAAGEPRLHLQSLVDPEALVQVSLLLLDHERRLGDLLHDWGARNSGLLSVQRMKNLMSDYPDLVRESLIHRMAWFAAVARDAGKDLRWKSLAKDWVEPSSGNPLARPKGEHAPIAASTKSRATRARLVAGATLVLRLRLGLGVGVKADLIAFLLADEDEGATVRDIAEATRYTVAAVRRAAEDLAAARLIESLQGQPTGYQTSYGAWAPLLGLQDNRPQWANWHERFQFALAFLQWADSARERPLSEYAFGAHGRQLLERYRPVFENDGVANESARSPVQDWGAHVSRSVRSLAARMEETA